KKLHPDLNPGNKKAEEQFKEVSAAHDLLSDADKRARFDRGEIDASGAERPRQRYYHDFPAGADADHQYADASAYEHSAQAGEFRARGLFGRGGGGIRRALGGPLRGAVPAGQVRVRPPAGTAMMRVPKHSIAGAVARLRGKGARWQARGAGGQLVSLKVMLRA